MAPSFCFDCTTSKFHYQTATQYKRMNPQGILEQRPLPNYLIDLGHSVARAVKATFGRFMLKYDTYNAQVWRAPKLS